MLQDIDKLIRTNDVELHRMKRSGELDNKRNEDRKNSFPELDRVYNTCSFATAFRYMCQNQRIYIFENETYVYFLDYLFVLDIERDRRWGNLTPNYSLILEKGISQIHFDSEDSKFKKDYNTVVSGMEILVKRILNQLETQKTVRREKKMEWFANILEKPAQHFDEALQRILFVNQIMWQTNHYLIGLGALDSMLFPYFKKDILDGYITIEDAKEFLRCFIKTLHQYYWFKSNVLLGDTGQIIVLGKSGEKGEYIYNQLTEIIIELVEELRMPDPKVLLRFNGNIPSDLLEKAIKCIATGVGYPILSNDDVVIPTLCAFGIEKEDAMDYTVSACWEPLIGGKSSTLNNMTTLNYMRPLENLFKRESINRLNTFDIFLNTYFLYLERNIQAVKRTVDNMNFQYDPILSVFIDGCYEKELDVSKGGAKYMNAGITSIALGNVIDSILNIKEYVYEKKELSLLDVKKIILTNYDGYEEVYRKLKAKKRRYGTDSKEVSDLSREIMDKTSLFTRDFRTKLNGRLKFGLSAPEYIESGKSGMASFDGRKKGEPYVTHISNDNIDSYTEILNFAANLDYGENRFNGNVVDFMVSPRFIQDNMLNFVNMIYIGMSKGVFQLQMNVVSSDILIKAKKNPKEFPHLIVRVWGFSAFYNDLPESYKELLIQRALINEGLT